MSAGRTNAAGGVQLPALTNPAAAANIQSGYQAINGDGEVVTGTYVPEIPEYGFLKSNDIAIDSSSGLTITITLPKPIKKLLGLNSALRGSNGEGDIDAIFTLPAGLYNVTPNENSMWHFVGGHFGYLSITVSGNKVTGVTSISPGGFNASTYKFYCGAYQYIPN